jgi:hypothetical protein
VNDFWKMTFFALGLIALYLILVYSGGAALVSESWGRVIVSETKQLQGGGGTPVYAR